jgi:hypothetical protein
MMRMNTSLTAALRLIFAGNQGIFVARVKGWDILVIWAKPLFAGI